MNQPSIHKNAIVETENIGTDTRIWAFTHILKGAKIGNNNNICDHCFIENKVITGDNVTIKCGVYLWDGITIENDVFIGPSATFTNDLLPRSKNTKYIQKNTLLKKGCSIGANATILPGIEIGEYAMIGAGAVVTKNVDDYSLVYGNPAIPHGYVCSCGKKLVFNSNQATCECKLSYKLIEGKVVLNI